jgi:hypothetical protein
MGKLHQVQIIAVPVACSEGYKDTWREVAEWAGGQLTQRFGDSVQVQYFNLFDGNCPTIPEQAQLPLVLLNGKVVTMGGKISIPAIRKRLEAEGISGRDS